MDDAVGLVQVYLRLNGYFTVTEYPVVEALGGGGYRSATDLDILAVRFPGAGRPFAIGSRAREREFRPDPALGDDHGQVDMIIGEVKEGRADLNRGATRTAVLRGALARFGCCATDELPAVVEELLRRGHATTACGHRVRLVAFGSYLSNRGPYDTILLGQVIDFLDDYIQANWALVGQAQFKDPAFNLLVTLRKARSTRATGDRASPSRPNAAPAGRRRRPAGMG